MIATSKKRLKFPKGYVKPILISPLDASILFFVVMSPEATKKKYRTLQPKIESDHVKNLCRALWGFKSTPYFQELAKTQLKWAKKYKKECEDFYKKRRK